MHVFPSAPVSYFFIVLVFVRTACVAACYGWLPSSLLGRVAPLVRPAGARGLLAVFLLSGRCKLWRPLQFVSQLSALHSPVRLLGRWFSRVGFSDETAQCVCVCGSFVVPLPSPGCYIACHCMHWRILFVRWVPVAPSIFSSFSAGPHPAALCFCEVGCGLFRAPAGCYCLVLFGAMQVRVCGCV